MGIYNGGIYSGIEYAFFEIKETNGVLKVVGMDDFINEKVRARGSQSLLSIFMIPKVFCVTENHTDPDVSGSVYRGLKSGTSVYDTGKAMIANKPITIGSYRPRNLKLLTYPFSALVCDTLDNSKTYRYEYFTDTDVDTVNFFMLCTINPVPNILVVPVAYNNGVSMTDDVAEQIMMNFTESVGLSGMPQCAFTIDSYRAWLAQQMPTQVANLASSAGSTIASAIISDGASLGTPSGVGSLASVGGQITNMYIGSHQGDKAGGTQNGSTEVGARAKMPYLKHIAVTEEYAKILDEYFDMYGYSCERVKVPNRNVRAHWTYTQTRDCRVDGNVPNDDLAKIRSIYNKGITFWKYAGEVGKYKTLANANVASVRRAWGVNQPPLPNSSNAQTNMAGYGQAGHMGL